MSGVRCNVRNLYETSNIDHALTGPVGIFTALVSEEECMVLAALDMLARLKDE